MIYDKSLFTKEALIKHIADNIHEVTAMKRASVKYCDPFTLSANRTGLATKMETSKGLKKTIVGNTYGWLDSHDDVHMDGIFTKSIQERKGSILFLHDHLNQVAARVGKFTDVYEEKISLSSLGLDMVGRTTCLLADAEISAVLSPGIYNLYENGEINQHSVGMQYLSLFYCVNSKDEYYKEYLSNWNKYIDSVINREEAEEQGYFFAVTEAKLLEISCVNYGSNILTPVLNTKAGQPLSNEPSIDTHKIKSIHNPNLF